MAEEEAVGRPCREPGSGKAEIGTAREGAAKTKVPPKSPPKAPSGSLAKGKPPGRKRPVHLTAEGWATARRLFEQDQLDAGAIAEMMEVTAVTVARRARADGWVRHGAVRDLIEAGDTHGVARMVARLTRAFEIQIAAVEVQLRGEAATSATLKGGEAAGHVERNARTLGSLAKTLDILIELRAGIKDLEPSGKDEDALRQELADRLDRLCRQGRAAGVSGRA